MRRLLGVMVLVSACNDGRDVDLTNATTTPVTASGTSATSSASGSSSEGSGSSSSSDADSGGMATANPTTGVDVTTMMADTGSSGDSGTMCLAQTAACTDVAQCCPGLECSTTTLGQVCCGGEGVSCVTPNGEDCCGDLLCIGGVCGYEGGGDECASPCTQPPALVIEKQRLAGIGGTFLGICGDANHTYGYHVPAANLPADDYSMQGAANVPVCQWHAAAIDIGMDWPASRDWLKWLIPKIADDDITGIAEVIGSYDGINVRYWSDSSGWSVDGVPYDGVGHDTHTHVAIYRSTALEDHGILAGWTANGGP
ncbi:hypothetical protein [Nannocystis sp. SCPEA4]|uniref:hypothetical protein n=1 Tax=Nannocystis sp. SCPEA4 TaxID=2996787 RepID=UPI0022712804|nr:hypothetical protein [Nannocystis sp. SCPEA4]MCY1054713.1 hypothetical protein [Nannocystis sp. SCPEA4]